MSVVKVNARVKSSSQNRPLRYFPRTQLGDMPVQPGTSRLTLSYMKKNKQHVVYFYATNDDQTTQDLEDRVHQPADYGPGNGGYLFNGTIRPTLAGFNIM